MKKHFFFDMDGTLTPSRSVMSREMMDAIDDLRYAPLKGDDMTADKNDIIIVSGAALEQIEKQVPIANICFKMPQNGNDGFATGHEFLWSNPLTWLEKHDIMYWCWEMLHRMNTPKEKWLDAIEDRGCQISYSLVGHNAPFEEKKAFDPTGEKRRAILEAFPFLTMSNTKIDVVIGGTTCLDFFREGCNKGANVKHMIDEMGWNKDECVYIGDALFPGGNDKSVVGVVDTVNVKDPEETLKVIRDYANREHQG